MDDINYKILTLLQSDSRMTYTQISKEVNLSIPTVKERINRMVDKGIIKNNTIEVNFKSLGRNIRAIICVDVKSNRYDHFLNFCTNNPYVTEFYRVVGPYNAIIFIAIEDVDKFEEFIDRIKSYGTCLTSFLTSTQYKNRILPGDREK
ncbi:MAG: Lrp/AsnC family transcriptional regulator [Tissierellaceae bacterium]|nr:Lrp/AsnC family transcriptional regulator [Tissierellaceae bacterium]